MHDHRRQTHGGFIEQDQPRTTHQGTADSAHLLLATRHRAGQLKTPFGQPRKQFIDIGEPLIEARTCGLHVGAHAQIVMHAELGKQAPAFGYMGNAGLDDAMRRHGREFGTLHRDAALGHRDEAGDHPQQGGLARTVGTDHGDRFARIDPHRHIKQGLESTVAGTDVAQFKHGRGS